ncbi:type I phosphodiesterase/nucleotide pyrophosphatase [Dyadobacter jejuensis]|uniref:Type I phosphodiesterase/nucleotide pyrophosphatase n=1 Tax=Dyadobacter jejuensis TaxID=1082580 RepID=A0A316APY4_9BACT|nr:alkaline phosphatase [Dyadobacter jejuensis]PWJ59548.1 type I phosphodiesterase/nucleotide pyrophosphatase [Dyadobacter jejuensis]
MKKLVPVLFLLMCCATAQAQIPQVKHIVLIGCDGLGAKAIPDGEMPVLKRLMKEGSWSLTARTVLPSSSAVNWASLLMSAGPTEHGFTEWGSKVPEIEPVLKTKYGLFPSIFSVVRDQKPKAKTAVIYTWGGIQYLIEKEAIDFIATGADDFSADTAAVIIEREKPLLTFIHLSAPDNKLHNDGFMSPAYNEELKYVDQRIGRIVEAVKKAGIENETIIMVTSDHGGAGKGHGGKSLGEISIPWIIAGAGVKKNHEIKDVIMTYDTAATISWILGLTDPQAWRGKPVLSVFE